MNLTELADHLAFRLETFGGEANLRRAREMREYGLPEKELRRRCREALEATLDIPVREFLLAIGTPKNALLSTLRTVRVNGKEVSFLSRIAPGHRVRVADTVWTDEVEVLCQKRIRKAFPELFQEEESPFPPESGKPST